MKLHLKPFLYAALMAAFVSAPTTMADTTGGSDYAYVAEKASASHQTWRCTENNRKWDTQSSNWGTTNEDETIVWWQTYQDGANVRFSNTTSGEVILVGDLSPTSIEVQNGVDDEYTFYGEGRLTGGTSLTKKSSGTLVINTENTYSGGTTIIGGTIVAGSQTALGTGDVTMEGGTLNMAGNALANDITLAASAHIDGACAYEGNLTVSAGKLYGDDINISSGKTITVMEGTIAEETVLSGEGQLIKTSSGTVNMMGGNTYTGRTLIKDGILRVRADNALGTGDVTITGGTLDMGGKALSNKVVINGNNVAFSWSTAFNGDLVLESGSTTGEEAIQIAEDKTATLKKGTISNRLVGYGKVVKDTAGTVYMSGANAYKGGTALKNGTLVAKSSTAFGSGEINMTGGTLNMGGYELINTVNVNTSSAVIKGSANFKGNLTLTNGTISGDPIRLAFSSRTATLKSGTVKNALTGTGRVVKETSGTVYLYGKNSYGNTYISAGTLVAKSSTALGTGNITMGGGTLDMGDYAFSNNIYIGASKATLKGGASFKGKLIITKGTLSGDSVRIFKDMYVKINAGTINNKLTGTGILVKETSGTATLSGSNTYTGDTYLKAGTLTAKSAKAFGAGTILMTGGTLDMGGKAITNMLSINTSTANIKGGTAFKGNLLLIKGTMKGNAINLASGKTATLRNGTVNNKLTGAGKVIKQTGGSIVISDANSYKGGTLLDGGTLTTKKPTSLGTGTVTMNKGTLNMSGKAMANTLSISGSSTLNGATAFRGNLVLRNGALRGQNINLNSGKTATLHKGAVYTKLIGNGKVVKTSGETVTLVTANTYKGGTIVKDGTLVTSNVNSLGTGNVTLAGGTLNLHGLPINNNITVNCKSATLNGPGAYKGKLTLVKGTLNGAWLNINPGKDAYLQSGTINNALFGKGSVYKTGKGTVTLTGDKYWEGNTYVQGGTLALTGTTYLTGSVYTAKGGKLDVRDKTTVNDLYLGGGTLGLTAGKRLHVTGTLTLASATKLALSNVTATMPALIKFATLVNSKNQDLSKFFGLSNTYKIVTAGRNLAILKNSPALSKSAAEEEEAIAMAAIAQAESASLSALGQSAWGTARAARLFDHTVRDHAHAQSTALDKNRSVWFAGMSEFSHVDDAADFSTTGGVIGMQFNGSMGGNTGIAIGQTYSRVSPAGTSRVKQQTQHAALYGTKMLYTSAEDNVSLTGTASYGTTDSDYHQDDYGFDWTQHSAVLGVRGTWEHKVGKSTDVYGFAGLEYLATDSGDTANGQSGSVQALQGSIGAGISHTEGRLTMHASAAFTPDMVSHTPVAESDGVRSGVRSPGRLGLEVNVGASYRISDQWGVNAGYTYHNEKHANSHDAYIGARCTF